MCTSTSSPNGAMTSARPSIEMQLPLRVIGGAETSLAWALEADDEHLALASYGQRGTDLLIEVPGGSAIGFEHLLYELLGRGLRVTLAHPERNPEFQRDHERLGELVSQGVLLQVNADSLLVANRRSPLRRLAERLCQDGIVHALASDGHRGESWRPVTRLAEAVVAATALLGPERARWLVETSPAAIINGEPLPEPPPITIARRRSSLFRTTDAPFFWACIADARVTEASAARPAPSSVLVNTGLTMIFAMHVTLVAADHGACTWFRMLWPAQALAGTPGLEITVITDLPAGQDDGKIGRGAFGADVIVIQRPLSRRIADAVPDLREQGMAVTVDLDDDFLALHPEHPAQQQLDEETNPSHLVRACLAADLVTAPTQSLRHRPCPARPRGIDSQLPATMDARRSRPSRRTYDRLVRSGCRPSWRLGGHRRRRCGCPQCLPSTLSCRWAA